MTGQGAWGWVWGALPSLQTVSVVKLYYSHGKTHGRIEIPKATVPLVFWGFQASEASMKLRSWDKVVLMRSDKPETLCPVFLPDGSQWVTCILVNLLFLLTFVFPSPESEVQAPTDTQAGPGSLLLP